MDRDKNAEVKDVNKSTINEKVNVQSGYENEYGSNRYSSDDVQGLEVDGESDCKDKEDEVKSMTGEEVMNGGKIIQNDKKETVNVKQITTNSNDVIIIDDDEIKVVECRITDQNKKRTIQKKAIQVK